MENEDRAYGIEISTVYYYAEDMAKHLEEIAAEIRSGRVQGFYPEWLLLERVVEVKQKHPAGHIHWDKKTDYWQAFCPDHGMVADEVGNEQGHDDVGRALIKHNAKHHGGDGMAAVKDLLTPPFE